MASRDAPIRRKLMTMSLVTSGVVLLLTCAAFLSYEFATYRQTSIASCPTLVKSSGRKHGADGRSTTSGTRRKFSPRSQGEKHIVAACLYLPNGPDFCAVSRGAAGDVVSPRGFAGRPSLRGRLSRELHAGVQVQAAIASAR